MDIYCMVTATGLVPMYDSDYDESKKLKQGEKILVSVKRPRNYENHKRFFSLLRLTVDNLPHLIQQQMQIFSEEELLDCIKIDLGMYQTCWHGGKEMLKLDSISFAKMDETEFQTFFNKALDVILRIYLRGTDKQLLLDEIERYR